MNRLTTKNSSNWFEFLGLRAHGLHQPSARLTPANVIWIQHTAPSTRRFRQPLPISGTYRVRDGWETLTYSVLWLCGLIAIGLCWLSMKI
jgi:hypothetical protein